MNTMPVVGVQNDR